MDKRISYKMVIDCETCPLDKDLQAVLPYNMFAYDIGYLITDKKGNIYKKRSFVVADIFLGEKSLMKSAYYAKKIPQYWEDIKQGTRKLATLATIMKTFYADVEEFGITQFYAHNMRFDYGALNNTVRWVSKSKYRYFFPYNAEICDTLQMARDIFGKMPSYRNFCIENGFLTKRNQIRYTAEILYKFISQDLTFVENHTGLEDTEIEKEILVYCYKRKKKMRRVLYKH